VTVDIDNDWGEFFLDDVLIHGWIWSTGCFGTGTLNQLGGSNFYAWDGGVNGNPLYHFDNYCLGGPPPCLPPQNPVATLFDLVNVHFTWDPPASGDVLSYNVFRDGTNIGNTTNTEYDDLGLAPGTYEYCVSAVYDDCESEQVCAEPVTIPGGPPPPTNLVAVEGINGIDLTWEGIGGAEWIQWDDGQNASAVGLTNGGTFSVASHWEPADLTNYDGYTLSKISFFPNDENASYILKVWTGPNGTTEVLSQPLATFNVGEWNEVELDNPVTISASTDFWFGYETTHLAGTWPAGCDAGPAIQYKGDMILTAGTWESLYVLTGGALDYNWNLAGYVELSDGIVAPLIGREVVPSFSGGSFASAPESKVTTNQYSKFIPSSTKDLSYNVYFKPEGGSYDSIANTVNTYYTHTEFVIGWNYYYVTSLLNGVESIPSNEDSVLITSIEENIFYSTMIYPNPASDVVNIKSDFEINNVMVYNFAGQIVANEQVNSKFYQINTSQYNAGIYFFRIETDEGTISKRIIIE
ncbi:MAG: T9SS type A sorting domain-containing protein, partial [Bacteroidetes bacterium]|nr:T9SS type A sorting domain-containing protein [Bacteroidota bacterium]